MILGVTFFCDMFGAGTRIGVVSCLEAVESALA